MNKKTITAAACLVLAATSAPAALTQWQTAVAEGTAPAATHFSTVTSPTLVDVGALSGDRSFEFIVKADITKFGPSAALIGTFNTDNGRQGLKVKQWEGADNTASRFGATAFGVLDHLSTVNFPSNVDTHIVFTSDGASTLLYVNGVPVLPEGQPFALGLALTGIQGLGGVATAENTLDSVVDPLTEGIIYGFASYDSALSANEIGAHYAAFLAPVPEPGSIGLAAVAVLALASRRRRAA